MLWIVLEALFQHVSVQEQWANLWWRSWNFPHGPGAWKVCKTKSSLLKKQVSMLKEYTAGHEGAVANISFMSIFSACFGLPTSVQLAATTCTCQIWISGWILPHFDVRTISVAWKLKKLSNIFWQKIFFLLHPLSKGVASLCNGLNFQSSMKSFLIISVTFLHLGLCIVVEVPDCWDGSEPNEAWGWYSTTLPLDCRHLRRYLWTWLVSSQIPCPSMPWTRYKVQKILRPRKIWNGLKPFPKRT